MNLGNEELLELFKEARTRAERAEQKLLVARQAWMDVVPAVTTALTAVATALDAAAEAERLATLSACRGVDVELAEEVTK